MSITVNKHTVLLTPEEQRSAAQYITALGKDTSDLRTPEGKSLPSEVNHVIVRALHAIKESAPISISTLPEEVTTTTAAAMLGITRPTLMKHVRNGRISAHMVGSHHRLFSSDVLVFREELKKEKRRAVFALMDLENELAEQKQQG
ncbi:MULTISPECIES: helix-turn-helix domain-containing protein [unclassified Corynebacterium]|uniref:helix-turn-helix domain-containing protein n=1 Tax=unclassified Corynebacterium TaxID=2624378 RepID=UPI0029C9EB4A|nr:MULTISPECIES: helix-turn-helix domain-containing protein [unclassified Corynebacterium]WPF66026.1 helix-turn-helix domain-containing protein [Corynebacterium sp. 22KM0430]WPF68519.1 helix-turn-helix domain-containing protein [Corynebacterium sp. 21KM1197]